MAIFRTLYAPLYFLVFLGSATLIISNGVSPAWLIPLFLGSVAVSLLAERVAPFDDRWNSSHGDSRRDIAHAVVNEGSILMLVLVLPIIASFVPWPSVWPDAWPFWTQVVLAIIILDAGITLTHYASHRNALLWRFHAVHHSVRRMYGFNGLLKHPVHQLIEISVGALPWLLMGIPTDVAVVGTFAVVIQLQLQHSNVDMRIGLLRYIWAVAPVHRHHHLASETEGDVNFGLFLTIWDLLLGTGKFVSSTHIRSGTVGLAGVASYPETYLAQLTEPFRTRQASPETGPVRNEGQA